MNRTEIYYVLLYCFIGITALNVCLGLYRGAAKPAESTRRRLDRISLVLSLLALAAIGSAHFFSPYRD